jgi:hypothetical protein
MSEQIKTSMSLIGVTSLPGLEAFKRKVSDKEISHAGKPTQSFHFLQNPSSERSTTVIRYKRSYKVVFDFYKDDSEIVLSSIDGNPDIDDTYSEAFIDAMTEGARGSLVKEENHNSYNDEYGGE